ncbi:hypothetical protein Clacol_007986 [Clathrus columnatus]|uniref:Methyltransferase domain-containing protein n=1 Tax=Clathrus columnatus TaxID=1419009 RepID=A0AAV5ALH8_9AGAM|nr:hypothetical protein Clacol_007986 [Clathrus columnatus]
MSNINDPPKPLDPSLYAIADDDAKFLKECTGITDDEELKRHILTVQAEAYARENAIMLDIGCCLGNDSRRAIADGFPLHDVLCSDLLAGFFNVGHKLYKTTPESYPLAFFEGDIFNTDFAFAETTTTTIPKLSTLTNLGQLKGKISVIHGSAFFHLFEDAKQKELAKILAQLLSPEPGSIILGSQGGSKTRTAAAPTMFSPSTWKDVWIGEDGPFRPDEVEVHAYARPPTEDEIRATTQQHDDEYFWLTWSVIRK